MHDEHRIRQYLTPEVAALAAYALVSSRLDFCNSLVRGLPYSQSAHAHVTPILKQLYWLPVKYHCMFKTATLVYKFLHSGYHSYFEPFLSLSSCSYSTRRSHPDHQYLTVPPFH